MENNKAQWSSHLSFIIATVGSAVGLGNIWRFPYIMGKNGGAVFLLVYLFLIAFICVIPLSVELLLGKKFKKDVVKTYCEINPKLKFFGWLNIITVVLIPCFYFVVGGWILNYIWIFLINNIPNDFTLYFSQYSSGIYLPVILTLVFLFLTAIFPYRGIADGIEKANNIMMPLFFVMLLFLAGFALTMPGASEGLKFMFKPDFSLLNKTTILTALGQALFTLSIGMGTILTYGSYLKKDTNILKSSYTLIICDTIIALLAGIMIFPIVFSYGVEPTAGAKLIFVSLPQIFLNLPYSGFFGILFFVLLFFAAITSGISIMETSIASFISNFNLTRKKATVYVSLIIGIISIPATLSFGVLENYKIFSKTIFDFLDYLTSNILLPFNTLFICLIAGWLFKSIYVENCGNKTICKIFDILLKFVLPIFLAMVLITSL